MLIRYPKWKEFKSGMEKFGSGINIPDPQQWKTSQTPKIRKSEKIYKKIVNGLLLVTENKFYECNLTR
jgi:hypothetical protein